MLEVKDWKLENIQSVTTHHRDASDRPGGQNSSRIPLQQARGYAIAITQLLEQDPQLVQSSGLHRGKLSCPYGYGVVLSNITRKAFNAVPALQQVLDEHLVICKDEFVESVDADVFQEQLWAMSPYSFSTALNGKQIDRNPLAPVSRAAHYA